MFMSYCIILFVFNHVQTEKECIIATSQVDYLTMTLTLLNETFDNDFDCSDS